MKKLINRVDTILDEQLQGFVAAHPGLTLHRDPTYITRADAPVAGKVGLICGGGSGHEPMHSGYIGDGMLDGAVPGEIFTSPTPDQVLACAEAVDSGRGVLLIIKNYTGDVLNFETAAELLHDMGHPVAVVLTDDDVAVKDSLYTAGRRGVAGTVLIEKLLGAAARRGDDLDSLAALGRKLNNHCHSIGIALGACTVPLPSLTTKSNTASASTANPASNAAPTPTSIPWSAKCSAPSSNTALTAAPCANGTATPRAGTKKPSPKPRCKRATASSPW